jgi:type II secretory ATPase GspE/PulE/Tfp pilus assembly ATPase PilB-like protein
MDELKKIIAEGQGVVLLASPPKHGRTSMLYAMIRAHDAYTSNVQTLELEPQAVIEGVRQNEFKVDTEDAEFATTVRSLLRRDPDVLGIAELPDEQTAQTVARADHKHTRTYVSVKADTAVQAIQLWCRLVGDQEQAAKALHGVVAHKLLRKLSDNAKIPFQPSPEMLKKLGLPKDVKTLYRTEGMVMVKDKMVPDPISNGTGYYGQIAAFAVHPIGEAERKLIASNDLNGLRAVFRQNKQPSVQTSAMQRVVMGETSVDEVLRVIEGKAPKKKAPAGGAGQAAQQAQPAAAKR